MFNNPYKYTDPSGMFSVLDAVKIIVAAVIIYATAGAAAPYFAAFMAGGAGAGAALATGMAIVAGGGFAAGLFATGTLKGGIRGAFSAVLTAGIGVAGLDAAGQVLAQAASGGIMESLQGGNFGHGFISAGVTALLMPRVGNIQNDLVRTATGAIVGGTLSEATGGKFANGAISGAIQGAMAGLNQGRSRQYGDGETGFVGRIKSWFSQKHREIAFPELSDPTLVAEMNDAWADSQWSDPGLRHEEGGFWDYEANGSIGVRRWDAGSRFEITVPELGANGMYRGLSVRGDFHVHPTPRGGGFRSLPPGGDLNMTRSLQLPGNSYIIDNLNIIYTDRFGAFGYVGTHNDVLGK